MNKYLFIDLMHLLYRNAYMHQDLMYKDQPVGAMYGVFKSLIKYKREYPLYTTIIAWDAGHTRRDKESSEGVSKGYIPDVYKGDRLRDQSEEQILVRWQIQQQFDFLKEGLSYTNCQQIQMKGYEADDVIACLVLRCSNASVIMTSDKDYYQLLEPGVTVYDPIHDKLMTLKKFQEEYGLVAPQQWVDACALSGDTSDCIYGVPGIGEKTAVKLIAKHKSLDKLLNYLYDQQEKGIALPKKQQAILEYENRVRLAFSLKRMDDNIPELPSIQTKQGDFENLSEFFDRFGFTSLVTSVEKLV